MRFLKFLFTVVVSYSVLIYFNEDIFWQEYGEGITMTFLGSLVCLYFYWQSFVLIPKMIKKMNLDKAD